ncbi:hypothetical protein IFT59_07700 [Rhizobium sp. CFBP 8752]|uniref:hypothetical protein n=1 Tax=Rhizobium sp. CFBP 8752 TaxID=2775301 RepID=UPI00177FA788|nr:hypothetical protein [Rhizobium sp. CFBP 8752]MBD8663136.1 hypothetical protein [Rhizobium sp. CFBP 8752]
MAGIFDFFRKKKTDGNDLETVISPEKQPNFLQQFMPEDPDKQRALAQSLMMGGAAMMAGGGPSAKPQNLLSVLGQGVGAGVGSYNDSLTNDLEAAKVGTANRATNVKLQTLQDSQNRANGFIEKYGSPSANGYSIEALFALHQLQLENGDEESARATQKMIQELQQTAAGNGMVMGGNGYELAPGYGDSLRDTERQKSLGSAVGQNAQITAEQKDFLAGQNDPAFRQYELEQKKAGVANPGSEFNKKSSQLAAERYNTLAQQGVEAQQMTGNVNNLTELGRAIGTGKWATMKKAWGPWAQSIGIEVEGLDEAQAYESLKSRIAPGMRVPGSGASSDTDVNMFMNSLPSLGNTPEGNAIIGDTIKGVQDVKIQAASIANRVMSGEIEWTEGDKLIAALPDPYANFKAYRKGGKAGPSREPKPTSGPSAKTGRVAAGPVVVATEEQFNALPKGTSFRFDDDPTVRVKQ